MRRRQVSELMDDPAITEADFAAILDDIARLNRLTFAHRPLLGFLDRLASRTGARAMSVLDVGAGGGDALRAAARWGRARGVATDLWGLDRSPWAVRQARRLGTPGGWITADLFALEEERRFDAVVCCLFAHHLDDDTLVSFLRWLPRHTTGRWLILDLHRHRLPWTAVWLGTRLLRMHPIVCHDGPVSIARAFSRADWEGLIRRSGVQASLRWVAPFRWAVEGPGGGGAVGE